jgi:hypothetical protein
MQLKDNSGEEKLVAGIFSFNEKRGERFSPREPEY